MSQENEKKLLPDSQCYRQYGTANPEVMDIEFWREMVRSGEIAYHGRHRLCGESSEASPTWCFHRFGSTRTLLPDGRVICIGGEHEDYYDPDFCIYNDVIVVQPNGDFIIYGYPKDVFPPTDGHTATFVGNQIFIVGSIGYYGERGTVTSVFSLDLDTYAMTELHPSGQSPGWIHGHRASLSDDGKTLRLYGDRRSKAASRNLWKSAAELDLVAMSWRTDIEWQAPEEQPPLAERLLLAGWKPIDPDMVDFEINNLRWEIPIGHPLFGRDVMPWASGSTGEMIYLLFDGTGRLALVHLEGLMFQNAKLPLPEVRVYDNLRALIDETTLH